MANECDAGITINGTWFKTLGTNATTTNNYSNDLSLLPLRFVPPAIPDAYRYIDPTSVRVQYGPNGLEKVSVQEEEPPMRGLFIVYIVDPETDEVTTSPAIVAVDANSAKLKVLLKAGLARDVDEYNIIVTQIGNVNARKRVQEVKVVKDK